MRLAYFCHYDGHECDKEIPKLNEIGEVIYPKKIDTDNRYWDSCMLCERNYSMCGKCYGNLNDDFREYVPCIYCPEYLDLSKYPLKYKGK